MNISGKLALTGSSIIGAGDIDPSHILINLYDNSGNLGTAAHIGNVLNGTVLVPFDTVTFHGMNGAVWAVLPVMVQPIMLREPDGEPASVDAIAPPAP